MSARRPPAWVLAVLMLLLGGSCGGGAPADVPADALEADIADWIASQRPQPSTN